MKHIDFPYHVNRQGRTAETDRNRHIRGMIELVLFTSPGERVNRPDFGSGILQLVFAPNSSELASAAEFMIQGNLQQWLGDLIQVEAVHVHSEDSTIEIVVEYILRETRQRETAVFARQI